MRRLPEVPARPKRRISLGTAFHMVLVAALFDAIQFGVGMFFPIGIATLAIPVVGVPVSFVVIILALFASTATFLFAFLTFFTWFSFRNVSLGLIDRFAIKRFLVWVLTSLSEVFLSALPGTTVGVIATILIVAEEDRQLQRAWEGKLRTFEKIAWALLKSGGNPEVAVVRLLRQTQLDRSERIRLQQLRNRSNIERRNELNTRPMDTAQYSTQRPRESYPAAQTA